MFGLRGQVLKLVCWFGGCFGSVIGALKLKGFCWEFFSFVNSKMKSKKKSKHRRHRRAKKKIRRWRRRALPYGLVMKCLRRPSHRPPRLVGPEKPVRWRWKKRKDRFDKENITLKRSTLETFCAWEHDFLALPRLIKSLSDREFHEKNIASCLARVASLRGMYDFKHTESYFNS